MCHTNWQSKAVASHLSELKTHFCTPPAVPYLFQAARNKCLNNIRDRKNTCSIEESGYDAYLEDTSVEVNELNRIIEEAVLSLPEKCGEVFRKSREEHLSNQEIAKEMQISVKTVEAQITKALKMIRKYLGETYSYIW